MNRFTDCFAAHAAGADADRCFADLVERSPFQLWGPGDPIPRHAVRLLIGVAPGSGEDMRLLDVMAEAMAHGPSALPTVDVFNAAHCLRPEDYRRYIPCLPEGCHTPIAGIWFGGQLTWFGQGQAARDQIVRMFHSTSARIAASAPDATNRHNSPRGAHP